MRPSDSTSNRGDEFNMNVSVLQPYYSMEPNDMEKCFDSMMSEIKNAIAVWT